MNGTWQQAALALQVSCSTSPVLDGGSGGAGRLGEPRVAAGSHAPSSYIACNQPMAGLRTPPHRGCPPAGCLRGVEEKDRLALALEGRFTRRPITLRCQVPAPLRQPAAAAARREGGARAQPSQGCPLLPHGATRPLTRPPA